MLKKMLIRKIAVATSIVIIMLMLYLIPANQKEIDLNNKEQVEYIYPNNLLNAVKNNLFTLTVKRSFFLKIRLRPHGDLRRSMVITHRE